MKKFALISGLLFLIVYFWVNTFTNDESSFDVAYPPITAGTLTSSEIPENPPDSDLPSQSSPAEQESRTFIILASFGDLEQAQKMAVDYTARYRTDITVLPPTSGGNYRISYGSYSSSGEAQAVLESLKQNGFPDAWLLTSK